MERQGLCLYRESSRGLSLGLMMRMRRRRKTNMGNEDDKEAAVLIEKLVKRYRFYMIASMVSIVLFLITSVGSGFDRLKFSIFLCVWGTFGILLITTLGCPFCRKPVLWRPHKSGSWIIGTCTPILPKKCPHCSGHLRVKKKKEGAGRIQK